MHNGVTGYVATITGLKGRAESQWKVAGVPLTALLALDDREAAAAYGGPLRPRVPVRKVRRRKEMGWMEGWSTG